MGKYDFGTSAVLVSRVSTSAQTDIPQREDLKRFAREQGYTTLTEFGTTESGFLEMDSKQGWNLVVDFFKSHPEYKVLICTELSRLSRVKSTLMLIEEFLIKEKIQLIVKDINFKLFNDDGEVTESADVVFTLFASFASSEMTKKKERFKRALKEYRKKGYSIGGKRLFGYDRLYVHSEVRTKPISMYRPNEKEKAEIIQIYKWYAHGIDNDLSKTSTRTITEKCIEEGMSKYLHSKRNVTKCLKEQAYTGFKETHNRIKNPEYWNYRKLDQPKYIPAESYECVYEPIFEGENEYLFDLVQKRMNENNSKVRKGVRIIKERKHTTILSKLLVCPKCGRFLHAEYRMRNGEKRFCYRCAYSRGVVHKCSFKATIGMQMIDSVLWEYCKAEVLKIKQKDSDKVIQAEIADIQKKIDNIQLKLDDITKSIELEDRIIRSKSKSSISHEQIQKWLDLYEKRVAKLSKEYQGLRDRQKEYEEEKKKLAQNDLKNIISTVAIQHTYTKEEIAKYLRRILRNVDVLFSDNKFTVLKVSAYTMSMNCYVCIYKRRTLNIEAVAIFPRPQKGSVLSWDYQKETFCQNGTEINVHDIYNNVFRKEPLEIPLTARKIPYIKLDCYEDDVRHRLDEIGGI